ncbi:MAG: Trk system potassium transporter TrkA [Burkholderiaceae bacterium]
MKIVILGAGQVGSSVAQSLAIEANDITVVDQDPALLAKLQERLDIRSVAGHASHPDVLVRAGIEDADLVLAVTSSDETNMVACQVAHSLFHTPTRLARVRSSRYLEHPELFGQGAIPIDVLISPEELVTTSIHRLIETPGALQILDFVGGRAKMVAVRVHVEAPLAGTALRDLRDRRHDLPMHVVAIFRQDRLVALSADTIIRPDDELFFLAARPDIGRLVAALRNPEGKVRRVLIAGGGNIGRRLAGQIERDYRVKLIEQNEQRCRRLAEVLDHAIVLHGDAADENLMLEEDIAETDVFCALTNDDEANILSAMLAKRLGARRAISIVNRLSYVEIAQGAAVDIAVSPAHVTIGALLTHVRRGDVVAVHSLRRGAAEAIEIIAHGDAKTSRIVGRRVGDIALPPSVVIGGIVRGEDLLLADHDVTIANEDHVILFLADKRQIKIVERLFQVAIGFV